MSRARRLEWPAACGLYIYLLVTLAFGLERFPALHGDEAWFGLFAMHLRDGGLGTLNGMNWYTGSSYG